MNYKVAKKKNNGVEDEKRRKQFYFHTLLRIRMVLQAVKKIQRDIRRFAIRRRTGKGRDGVEIVDSSFAHIGDVSFSYNG